MLDEPQMIDEWRSKVALPIGVEEEAFFYESLYRQICLESRESV